MDGKEDQMSVILDEEMVRKDKVVVVMDGMCYLHLALETSLTGVVAVLGPLTAVSAVPYLAEEAVVAT